MKKLVPFLVLLTVLSTAHAELQYGMVTLSASAQTAVENDELHVQLQVFEQGQDTGNLTQLINTKTGLILDALKTFPDIEAKTTQYTTRPIYRDGKIRNWQVTQMLSLKTKNFDQMSQFIGNLDNLAHIQSMQFRVSRAKTEQTKASLIQSAITKFRAKAQMIAEGLGESHYAVVNMNVDNGHYAPPQPMYARSAMMESADMKGVPAALEGGSNNLSVNVNGTIHVPISAP